MKDFAPILSITSLAGESCKPLRKGSSPLESENQAELLKVLGPDWRLNHAGEIEREYRFRSFESALKFVNAVAAIAEIEDHHPDIFLSYNLVRITLSTHVVKGLSRNDFIVAAKIEGHTRT